MLNQSLYDERLQVDQYKIYPTAIVPWTQIKIWYEEGSLFHMMTIYFLNLLKNLKKRFKNGKDLIVLLEIFLLHILAGDIKINM